MKISNTFLTLSGGLLLVAGAAIAQAPKSNAADYEDIQIQLLRKDLRDQTKQIVAANLPLSSDEAAKFWPLFDSYAKEASKIYDHRFALTKAYAAVYHAMTDASAADYIRGSIKNDEEMSQLRLAWVPKFEPVIGEKKAAIFFQIERRVALLRELQLDAVLPLVQP
jgi:hypothetical protein